MDMPEDFVLNFVLNLVGPARGHADGFQRMFSHQKLEVYRKAVAIAADLGRLATDWDKRHAVVDHLSRASESVVLNLAEAARLRSVPAKECTIDYLDLCQHKDGMDRTQATVGLERLEQVAKLLRGFALG